MTQELVLVVLLTGLIGLVWIVTLATINEDQPDRQKHEPETSSNHSDDAHHSESALNRHTIAA